LFQFAISRQRIFTPLPRKRFSLHKTLLRGETPVSRISTHEKNSQAAVVPLAVREIMEAGKPLSIPRPY
jgi:hypothetical protein